MVPGDLTNLIATMVSPIDPFKSLRKTLNDHFETREKVEIYLRKRNLAHLIELLDEPSLDGVLINFFLGLRPLNEAAQTLTERYEKLVNTLILEKQKRDEQRKQIDLEKKAIDKALCRLSELQKDILIKLYEQTEGDKPVKWTPSEWFEKRTSSEESDRVVWSKALKRLEDRELVSRQPNRNSLSSRDKNIRTTYVKLTKLGHEAAKRLTSQSEANVVANKINNGQQSG